MLSAADSSAQLIDQVRCDRIVVGDHDLIVMFEICFRRKKQTGRIQRPPSSVGPAAENILLGIDGVVDANIELIGKDRVGHVQGVVEGIKIVRPPLDWQWIKLENRVGSRIEAIRGDDLGLPGMGKPVTGSKPKPSRTVPPGTCLVVAGS